jgi:hypothetical protein
LAQRSAHSAFHPLLEIRKLKGFPAQASSLTTMIGQMIWRL